MAGGAHGREVHAHRRPTRARIGLDEEPALATGVADPAEVRNEVAIIDEGDDPLAEPRAEVDTLVRQLLDEIGPPAVRRVPLVRFQPPRSSRAARLRRCRATACRQCAQET